MAGSENFSLPNPTPHTNGTSQSIQEDILKTSALYLNVLFGSPIHFYILWLIVTGRGVASEFLFVNLTVCEILQCLCSFTILLLRQLPELFHLTTFAKGISFTALPLFYCLICVERYQAVVHPVTFLKLKPLRYKVICSVAVWLTGLGSCVFTMLTSVAHARAYMICAIILHFLFLSVNLFCCSTILWALKKPGPGERGREREEENRTKRRAFSFILIITVTMVIMYLPSIITGMMYSLSAQHVSMSRAISFFGYILAGFVQPVLYLHRAGKLIVLESFLCFCFI